MYMVHILWQYHGSFQSLNPAKFSSDIELKDLKLKQLLKYYFRLDKEIVIINCHLYRETVLYQSKDVNISSTGWMSLCQAYFHQS